jgi:peptidoglycan/LPS O-acetylase OafA/YrhL/predicted SAM-dependent methyltransferase
LDSLRLYSALAVILTHVELVKAFNGLPNLYQNRFVANAGPAGVYFFFTLSGFLITRLLLIEKHQTGSIGVFRFYVRRSLRIWPLYFLIVVLGFFVLPGLSAFHVPGQSEHLNDQFGVKLGLYLFFIPQVSGAFLPKVPNIGHMWSIGVEEVFYVFWPLVVISFRESISKYVRLILALLTLKGMFFAIYVTQPQWTSVLLPWKEMLTANKFECMIVGAVFATSRVAQYRSLLSHRLVQLASVVAVPGIFLLYNTPLDDLVFIPFAFVFSIIIWNAAHSGNSIVPTHPVFDGLGRITYGIYCYHFMFCALVINLMPRSWFDHGVLAHVTLYAGVLLATVAVSKISYIWYERPFNRLKHRLGTADATVSNVGELQICENSEKEQEMSRNYVQFGCGHSCPKEWTNFDASPTLRFEKIPGIGKLYSRNGTRFPEPVRYGDIVRGLPVDDGSCAGVYCSHVLEHLALTDLRTAIQNSYRILQPGGRFRFVLPDLEYAIDRYCRDDSSGAAFGFMRNTLLGKENRSRGLSAFLSEWAGNYQHLWMWDLKAIARELEDAGFIDVRRAQFGDSVDLRFNQAEDEDRWNDALGVECQKPEAVLDRRAA